MHQRNLLARIENAERVADAALGQTFSGGASAFRRTEPPFFGFPIEEQIAAKVKCPLHGERFKPIRYFVYVAKWLREKKPELLWSWHSEQYRKAWFASFPPELWPAEEVGAMGHAGATRPLYLKLKDGTRLSLKDGTGLSIHEP